MLLVTLTLLFITLPFGLSATRKFVKFTLLLASTISRAMEVQCFSLRFELVLNSFCVCENNTKMEFSLSRYFLLDAREKVVDMNYGLRKLSRTYYHRKQNGSVVRKVRGRRKSGEREEKKVTVERRPPEELGCCGRILEPFRSVS